MKDTLALLQCKENLRALFAFHALPELSVIANMTYKVLYLCTSDFLLRMDALTENMTFEIYPFIRNHGLTAKKSWRERRMGPSMQVTYHDTGTVECDVDLFNPGFGVLPAFFHLFEILNPGSTEPFRVLKGLKKRGLSVRDVRLAGGTKCGGEVS